MGEKEPLYENEDFIEKVAKKVTDFKSQPIPRTHLFTVKEVAFLMKTDRQTVRKHIRNYLNDLAVSEDLRLKAELIGSHYMIKTEEVERYTKITPLCQIDLDRLKKALTK